MSDENRGSDKTSEPVHDDLSPEVSAGSSITDSIHATSEVLAGVSARPVPHTRPTVAIYGAYGGPAVSPFDEEDREPCWLQILSGAATVGLAEDDCSVTLAAEEDAEACWLSILGDDETITMDEDDGSTSATTASVPSTAASTVPDYLGAQLAAFALKDSSAPHTTDISNGTPAPGHSTHAPEVTKAAMTSPIANSSSSQPKSAVTPVLASRDLPSDFTGHLQSAASGLSIPGVALTAVPKFGLGVPAVSAHASPGLANDEPVTHTPRTGPHGVQSTMLVRGDQPPAPVAQ